MTPKLIAAGIALVVLALLVSSSLFVVDQAQQALVLQFGEKKRVIESPGLHAKIPLIQSVVIYDKRVLDVEPPMEQVILADQKRLDVDAFARYRIADPLLFYQSVGTVAVVEQRLAAIVSSSLRRVLGNVPIQAVLSGERDKVMTDIRRQVGAEARQFGVQIVDVRIRRADLPEETSQAIYARMRSEREREAAEFRAEGQELSQEIRARADRERTVILAQAQRQAQILRGQGDNQALSTIGKAADQDPAFYVYYRTLEAYRTALTSGTTLVLSPTSRFLRFLNAAPPAAAPGGAPTAGGGGGSTADDTPPPAPPVFGVPVTPASP